MKKLFLIAASVMVASFASNCSISDSVNTASNSLSKSSDSIASVSGSIKSISGSISGSFGSSSGGGDKKSQLYIRDISDLTRMYFATQRNNGSFVGDLSEVALKHNITNWEASAATYIGIGKGLKRADLSKADLEVIKKEISTRSPLASKLIQDGFDSI